MDENAEIEYSITEGDGYDMFGITTDKDTQEGIITVKKVRILTHFILTSEIPAKMYLPHLFSIFSATCCLLNWMPSIRNLYNITYVNFILYN